MGTTQYVALDTNILRQLKLNFYEHIDFLNLQKNLELSGNVLFIPQTVRMEIERFFHKDVVDSYANDYSRLESKAKKIPFLNTDFRSIEDACLNAKVGISNKINQVFRQYVFLGEIDIFKLINFSIENKRISGKDNTRDYIILNELIALCTEFPNDRIIYISSDKIFKENTIFTSLIKEEEANNLLIYDSIPQYLREHGFTISFLNNDIVQKAAPHDTIREVLIKDSDCFPSYVSSYYESDEDTPDLEVLDYTRIKLNDYYTMKGEDGTFDIVFSILVHVIAIFFPEKNVVLSDYPKPYKFRYKNNRIDENNRPIYDNDVLFIFEGKVNVEHQTITEVDFVDFIP